MPSVITRVKRKSPKTNLLERLEEMDPEEEEGRLKPQKGKKVFFPDANGGKPARKHSLRKKKRA